MPVYRYKALDAQGNEQQGNVEASTRREAISMIREQGLFPIDVTGEGSAPAQSAAAKPSQSEGSSGKDPSGPSLLFGAGGGPKCTLNRGIEQIQGRLNLLGENQQAFLVFTAENALSPDQYEVKVHIDDLQSFQVSGLFRKTLTVTTQSGQQFQFTGNVKRMATLLRFELAQRRQKDQNP